MATIKARIHRHTSEEMRRLGKKCLELYSQGVTLRNIAQRFGVSSFSVRRWIDKAEEERKE